MASAWDDLRLAWEEFKLAVRDALAPPLEAILRWVTRRLGG